jgi:hypothetical protein
VVRVLFGQSARGVVQNLAVPHGFTLVISGTAAMLFGDRGYPDAMGIWLFIAAANAALVGWQVVLRGHRHPVGAPVSGFGVFNVAPTLTVPAVFGVTHAIHSDDLAFLCAGLLSVSCYVVLLGGSAALLSRPRTPPAD